MPAGPGESCLTTVFADIHYYFSPPTTKPQHHRFSRGSYLYIFHSAAENRAKVEIANHAGTPDQDAFSGSLNNLARLSYSYNQPNLVTLTVDGASIQGHDQWHIPSFNERNEQKYLYKIHSLDVYLWTESDAATLLKHFKSVLPADKIELKDVPANLETPAEHRDSMSPVVQQLERTAIGSHFPPRSGSTTSAQSLPGPPTPATSIGGASARSPQPVQAQAQAPMAYNPAAPGAPETRIYREKTPPPLDDGSGTGLSNAAKYDSLPQPQYANVPSPFQSSNQPTPNQAYFSGPPQQQSQQQSYPSFAGPPQVDTPPQRTQSGSLPPPPPPPSNATSPPQQGYNPSFAGPPTQQQPTSPPPNQEFFNRQSTHFGGGPPGQTQFAQYNPAQRAPSFGPGAIASPGMPGGPPTPSAPPGYSSPGVPPPPAQLQPQSSQQGQQGQGQVFGYSNYSYTAQQNLQGYNPNSNYGYSGGVHDQVYRPTEGEQGAHGRPQTQRVNSEQRSKFEGKVKNVEGKVGGYIKKLDKLW